MGLEAQTDSAHLGHELFVVVDVEAAKAATNVGLAFLVADAAEVDADVPEPALQLLDAESIAEVQAGNNAYELTLVLPEDAVAPGSYYLLAVVDPIGATPETDEDDNGYTVDEIRALGVRVTLNAPHALPDLVLEGIELDRWLVDVDQTPDAHPPAGAIGELPNADFGLSATIRSAGTETLNGVELGVFLQIPGEPATLLEIWDTAAQAYASSTTVASVVPGESSIVHLDLRLPAFLRSQLGPFLGDVVVSEVFVVVDPNNEHAEFEGGAVPTDDVDGDNLANESIAVRVSNSTPRGGAPVGELAWDVPFVKQFSNGNVGVGLRFGANANVGANGIHAEAEASVPLTLAGSSFELLDLDAVGLFNPLHKADNGMVVTLKALNVKLYERRTKEDEALAPSPLTLQKEQSVSTTFAVGPVPMFVKLGARGTVGLDLGAHIGSTFELAARPFLDFDVFGEGGVGASYLGWTLGGGIGADLKLVDEKFHAGITAQVTYDSVTSIMTGVINEIVANELEGPSGRVFLFVTAEGKILWKTITERWEYVIARWSPFVKSDTLFNQTQTLNVTIE